MRTLVVAAMAASLLVGVVPAMASDDAEFVALSKISLQAEENLAQMPDDQLASVEGQNYDNVCIVCNFSIITQTNTLTQTGTAYGGGRYSETFVDLYGSQRNYADVYQSLRQYQ